MAEIVVGTERELEASLDRSNQRSRAMVRFYRPELDVLRFCAFLMVFFYHGVNRISGFFEAVRISGAFGVCLFFLLSSYLITELLEREETQSDTIHLRAFYIRRCLRIWPLYLSFVVFDFILQHYLNPGSFPTSRLLAFLLIVGNQYVAHYGFSHTISTPLWSISVEEQFYILWPSMRKYLHRRGSIVFSLAMFVLAYVALALLCHRGAAVATGIWVNSLVQFQFFSTGALLAFALRGRTPTFHPLLRAILILTGLALLITAQLVFQAQYTSNVGNFYLVAPGYLCVNAGCVLMFLGFLGEARLGASKLLVYLGKISFGLYVFHWMMWRVSLRVVQHMLSLHPLKMPLANALEVLLAFVLTVGMAALSYRFFESPILRYKNHFEYIKTRSI
jgi:peptidoglycan/LPS O-acetylase OafA/YrhL